MLNPELTELDKITLKAICVGKFNCQIAYELNVREATIKHRVSQLLRKFGVRSRTQLLIAALVLNIIKVEDLVNWRTYETR